MPRSTPPTRGETSTHASTKRSKRKSYWGLDQGPHARAEDVITLPHMIKMKWLESAENALARERRVQQAEIGGSKRTDLGEHLAVEPRGQRKDKEDSEAGDEHPVGAFSG